MGFIKGRKNNNNENKEVREEILNEESETQDEEDDFSEVVINKTEKKIDQPQSGTEKKDQEYKQDELKFVSETNARSQGEDFEATRRINRDEFREAARKEFFDAADDVYRSNTDNEKSKVNDVESDFDSDFDYEDPEENTDLYESLSYDKDEDDQDDKYMRKTRRYEMKKRSVKIICLAAGIVIAAAAGVYIYGYNSIPVNVIADNVYIETVDVGGLTYDEAVAKLTQSQLLADKDITLVCANNSYSIKGSEVGLVARVEDTVNAAMEYGKSGNKFKDGYITAIQALFPHTVTPKANVDEGLIREKLMEFGKQIYGERIEHSLEFGDGVVIASAGKTGFDTNTDTAYQQITEAIENEKFTNIDVDLKSGPPSPLTVEQVDGFTYKDPIDAYYQVSGNEVMVIAEVSGRYIDKEETAAKIAQVVEGAPNVEIPYYVSEAAIKASDLQSKLFNTTLGSYSTNYGGSTANRAANVANAARRINGKILASGEVFSFNGTVGKRTVENGFKEAPEYIDGATVMGIGGGTCQVSSTLYNAVLYSDLGIVYRLNHMFPVSYCPLGQDATVSDSGVDFKFVNDTDYPVKIVSSANGGTITVSIVGTQRDVPHTVKIKNTSSATSGGTNVSSVRYVYDPDGNLIREEKLSSSYYMAH